MWTATIAWKDGTTYTLEFELEDPYGLKPEIVKKLFLHIIDELMGKGKLGKKTAADIQNIRIVKRLLN